jgi:hypothetical protein
VGAVIGCVRPALSDRLLTYLSDSPTIGGTFSHPAEKFPGLFDIELFREYPYLLPGIIASSIAFLGSALAFFQLEEVRLQLEGIIIHLGLDDIRHCPAKLSALSNAFSPP